MDFVQPQNFTASRLTPRGFEGFFPRFERASQPFSRCCLPKEVVFPVLPIASRVNQDFRDRLLRLPTTLPPIHTEPDRDPVLKAAWFKLQTPPKRQVPCDKGSRCCRSPAGFCFGSLLPRPRGFAPDRQDNASFAEEVINQRGIEQLLEAENACGLGRHFSTGGSPFGDPLQPPNHVGPNPKKDEPPTWCCFLLVFSGTCWGHPILRHPFGVALIESEPNQA